jgi:hypothetical protein
MVVYTSNPSTQEVEAVGLCIQDQNELHGETLI